jgi:hypothetical protein
LQNCETINQEITYFISPMKPFRSPVLNKSIVDQNNNSVKSIKFQERNEVKSIEHDVELLSSAIINEKNHSEEDNKVLENDEDSNYFLSKSFAKSKANAPFKSPMISSSQIQSSNQSPSKKLCLHFQCNFTKHVGKKRTIWNEGVFCWTRSKSIIHYNENGKLALEYHGLTKLPKEYRLITKESDQTNQKLKNQQTINENDENDDDSSTVIIPDKMEIEILEPISAEEYKQFFKCFLVDENQRQYKDRTIRFTSIPTSNVGYKLLKKMGWKENTQLGKNGETKTMGKNTDISHDFATGLMIKLSRNGLGSPKFIKFTNEE